MTILTDAENHLTKIQHLFMIKIGIEGNFLNFIKSIYKKTYTDITVQMKD